MSKIPRAWRWEQKGPLGIEITRGVLYRLEDVEAWKQSHLIHPREKQAFIVPISPF